MSDVATLEVRNLYKNFGSHEVLKGINLTAHKGDVISIIGSSGSGKSTFLRCINLLETPSAGDVLVHGELIRMKSSKLGERFPESRQQVERIRSRLAMVFQSFNLWSHMTVLQNLIEAPVTVKNITREQITPQAEALLRKVGLLDKRDAYPGRLSGGQKQRVAIARALAMQPAIILFDEPTSALDPELTGEVLRTIRQLAAEHMTMLVVTHEMAFAREVAHRVLFMDAGVIVEDRPAREFFASPRHPRACAFLQHML